ncbi:hypothetical protein TNCT_168721 [Trichonephila clavata]|uniref:Uncharacterized protein n=1 Tax=Trichonephila clavata TaxID=2740835 RepID=A0A8X6GQN3_TRICU|nr:hypothetical protein TNCT_168721 [Trichonephila clavata]
MCSGKCRPMRRSKLTLGNLPLTEAAYLEDEEFVRDVLATTTEDRMEKEEDRRKEEEYKEERRRKEEYKKKEE